MKITAPHTVEGYADRVNKCTVGILYGVNGVPDRLFVSGNPDGTLLNYDWWSGQNDPTYWPDTGYGTVGSAQSALVGYCLVGNCLAAFKDSRDPERSVVLRTGELAEDQAAFPVYNTLQGPGAIAPDSIAYLGSEPLFLTGIGVYALTTSDVTGERYQQNRSYYIDAVLKERSGLEGAVAFTYNDMYWLCLGEEAFILDGLQSLAEGNQPYSTRRGFLKTRTSGTWPSSSRRGCTPGCGCTPCARGSGPCCAARSTRPGTCISPNWSFPSSPFPAIPPTRPSTPGPACAGWIRSDSGSRTTGTTSPSA